MAAGVDIEDAIFESHGFEFTDVESGSLEYTKLASVAGFVVAVEHAQTVPACI